VVATSYSPKQGWLRRGVRALERAGFQVILDNDLEKPRRFTRDEDERRAESLMGMWLDPHIHAIIGGTGGYGAVRMLPHLEPAVFRLNPKSFVGYSDITALHLWLMRQCELRCFHGPTVDDLTPSMRDASFFSLINALTIPRPSTPLGRGHARCVVPGTATGRLVGGNLSLVQQTIGTNYEIDTNGAILFLEETKDPMSVVDERLVHLRAAGLMDNLAGIVIGQLSVDRSEEEDFEDFILDLVSDLGVPVMMDFPAGHENPNLTLPLGTEVEMAVDDTTGWISYAEEALTSD
jgi:muramoyltetrapeptide carboxypeptidase